jgi:hypothetical protein
MIYYSLLIAHLDADNASYQDMMFNNARHFGLVDIRQREMQQAD